MTPEPGPVASVQVDVEAGWRGGQRQVFLLCRGLAERGHPVVLVAREGEELGARARRLGVDVHELAVRGEADFRAARELAGVIRDRSPAVVGFHSGRSHGVGALARVLLGRGRPPFVVTRRVVFPPGRDPLSRLKYRWAVDGYIAISRAVAAVLCAAGVPRERVRVVYSGVDTAAPAGSRAALRERLGVAPETPVVCTVAALSEEKGVGDLLEAVAAAVGEVPELHAVIVGDGPQGASLRYAAKVLEIADRAHFTGHQEETASWIGGADLLVMPSRAEGLGTVVLDAQLLGVPVVATRAGGLPEGVIDEETGLLTPIGAPEVLAAEMVRLLRDSGLRKRLTAAAAKRARELFTADAMVEGTLEAYRALISRSGRR